MVMQPRTRSLNVEVELNADDADRVEMLALMLQRKEDAGDPIEYDAFVRDLALVGLAALQQAQSLGLLG